MWKEQVPCVPDAKEILLSADPGREGCFTVASTTLIATLCHGAGRYQTRAVRCAVVSWLKPEAGPKDTVAAILNAPTPRKAKNILKIVDAGPAKVII